MVCLLCHSKDQMWRRSGSRRREVNIDMVINVPEGTNRKDDITAGYMMRRAAVDFGASLITNIKCAVMLAEALAEPQTGEIQHIGEFHSMKAMQGMQI